MGEILKFQKPTNDKVDEEDLFIESLNEWQFKAFGNIIAKELLSYGELEKKYKEMQDKYYITYAQCEILKNEIKKLRKEK